MTWLNRIRTYLSRVLAVPDTKHLYDCTCDERTLFDADCPANVGGPLTFDPWDPDPVRYYRGRSGDDEEWPVHGEDPRI